MAIEFVAYLLGIYIFTSTKKITMKSSTFEISELIIKRLKTVLFLNVNVLNSSGKVEVYDIV